MSHNLADVALVRHAQKQPAGLAEDVAELLAAQPDRRSVNDRHHLFDTARQQCVKQNFIGVLQSAQKRVSQHVAVKAAKGVISTPHLIVEL